MPVQVARGGGKLSKGIEMRIVIAASALIILGLGLASCAVVDAGAAVVGAGVSVIGTAVDVTGDAVGAVTGGSDDKDKHQ